mgnify:CR=1 FL=1
MNRKLKITELNRISTEEFKEAEKLPLVVVLDNIRSLHNIGSVFRTSDAFRIKRLWEPNLPLTGNMLITLLKLLITSGMKDIRFIPWNRRKVVLC